MRKLEHSTELYLGMSAEAHQAFEYIKQYHVDADLLLPVHSGLEQDIMTSVERLSQKSVSLPNVIREVVEYASSLKQAALRYLDVIEKQKTLIVDSISPLIKANLVFRELYGSEKYYTLGTTKIQYFDKNNHPHVVMDELSRGIINKDPDRIKVTCHEYMNCRVTDGQLEYPILSGITATVSKPLFQHGYTTDDFTQELQRLTGEKEGMSYLSLVTWKQDIIKHLNQLTDQVTAKIQNVRPGRSDLKQQIRNVMSKVGDLQSYTVALSTIMFLLQSVSSSAYEAGYQLHLAELNYQTY